MLVFDRLNELTSELERLDAEKKYSLAAWITRFSALSFAKDTEPAPFK